MKPILLAFLTLMLGLSRDIVAAGAVSVRGYMRSDGTYVQPHYRSAPDGDFYNNWSTKGNINPYTGKEGTKSYPSSSGYAYPSASGYASPSVYPSPAGVSVVGSPPSTSDDLENMERDRIRSLGITDDLTGMNYGDLWRVEYKYKAAARLREEHGVIIDWRTISVADLNRIQNDWDTYGSSAPNKEPLAVASAPINITAPASLEPVANSRSRLIQRLMDKNIKLTWDAYGELQLQEINSLVDQLATANIVAVVKTPERIREKPTFFTVGSTKNDVLTVQGSPKAIGEWFQGETYFEYAYSRVVFDRDGKVKSWNDISRVLKAKLVPAE